MQRRHRRPNRVVAACLILLLGVAGCTTVPKPLRPGARGAGAGSSAAARPGTRSAGRHAAVVPTPRGSEEWRLSRPARHGEIEGYATVPSGLPGTRVDLRVSTAERSYRVAAYRLGAYVGGSGLQVWGSAWLPGRHQPRARFLVRGTRTVVAPWSSSVVVPTTGWEPGLYVFKLVTRSGWQAHVPYVVSSPSAEGRVVLVAPVTTWQAYNDWGGYSLYKAPTGDRRSWAVSFDRPYPAPGSGDMMFGAVPVVLAAERLRIPLGYLTNVDVEDRPTALRGARGYVSMGHDEYWTRSMRARVAAARDAGTNLAFLGANTSYWRIRLGGAAGQPGRLATGYRDDAASDPLRRTADRTGRFRDGPSPDPEERLTGMRYECFPVDEPYQVVAPDWWGFAGTGVRRGDSFGHLVGVEADRVYPLPSTPRPLQILASVSYPCLGVRTWAQSVYYTHPSGAGVFTAGTLRWTCALQGRCRPYRLPARTVDFVQRVTANLLRAFAQGPVGSTHPARDNVARFHLPRRGEVPASN